MSHASLADPPRLGIHDRDVERRQGAYLMAVPDEEHQDLQHRMLRLTMGSLYAARDNVRAALVPSQVRPAVLDITAGSGRWAIDMAREFPHADVVGIDVTSSNLPRGKRLPPNLHFETTDPNEGMAQYAGKFNVVHARFAHLAIRDFHGFLYDCARALRPGGVLLLVDRIHALVDKDKNLLPVVEEGQPG
ncbi:hypothetical protein FRB99_003541 [Tulasnella sp. 403]|nr:hypothetical protein FRB99_003541 [Tulasnella sp. 403]